LALSPGQAHDLEGADALLPDLAADALIADKAFDAEERVLRPLAEAGRTAVIPPKGNRKAPRPYDKDLYKARHLIEVVLTQMTKPHALAVGVERDGVADLDLAVGDEHSVDQQLHELALLREVRAGQTGPNPLTEVGGRGRPTGELGPPIHLCHQLAGLRIKGLQPLLQPLSSALVFRQRNDGE
jgi:hypothetical protein